MRPDQRLILRTPLTELWNDHGAVDARPSRDLRREELRELLRNGPVQFVVADVGKKPEWIPIRDCFRFWKSEVHNHVGESGYLDDYPGHYFFAAQQWQATDGPPIVVLVMHR
jgi:hypothetical protein